MSKKSHSNDVIRSIYADSAKKVSAHVFHQLAHSALGTVSPEVFGKMQLPIGIGFSSRQYNRLDPIKRCKTLLGESDLVASVTVSEIITELELAGVGVNQVQVLLDPFYSQKAKEKAFSALLKNLNLNEQGAVLTPQTATLAMASKQIPYPDTSWKGRFSLIAAFRRRGQNELVENINTTPSYLWVFPPAGNNMTGLASFDSYRKNKFRVSAEMGMGFSIIQAPRVRDTFYRPRAEGGPTYLHYNIYTPICDYSEARQGWYLGDIVYSDIRDGAPWNKDKLIDLLPKGLESLPRVHSCPKCRMLFIDNNLHYKDIPIVCNC